MRGVRNRVYFLVVYSSEASDAESMRGIHDARFICIDVISTSERVEKWPKSYEEETHSLLLLLQSWQISQSPERAKDALLA